MRGLRGLLSAAGFILFATMLTSIGFAQSPTGIIRGTVLDPSGAAIPGASLTIVNTQTGETKVVTSDGAGRYILNLVPPGVYTVTASATGFQPKRQDNLIVQVQVSTGADFTLQVGQVSEQVVVTSQTPALETNSSTLGTVVTSQSIADLPLNGRNPFNLAALVPGVSMVGNASTPHIAGSRNGNNEEQLDGMTNILPENNVGNNETAYTPIVDSVQEFNVQTSVLPAQYGRFSGGVINLVTKPGTNQFHGTIFDFSQTNALYAKPYFSSGAIPSSHLYQFGGTVGGPIAIPRVYNGHNNSFFFFAFERSLQASANTELDSVPTAAERTGDFSGLSTTIYDPSTATPVSTPTGTQYERSPFTGNIVPTGRLSAVALKAVQFYPLPNTGAPGQSFNNYLAQGPSTNDYFHWDLRLDHNFGPKWHSFVRLSHFNNPSVPFSDFNSAASATGGGPSFSTAWSVSFDNAITLSPSLVMDLRAGFSRSTSVRTTFGQPFDLSLLGFPSSYITVASQHAEVFPQFGVGNGYTGLGSSGYVPLLENPSAADFNPSVVKVIHGNSITIGGEWRKLFLNFYQYGYPSGQFNIDQTWTQQIVNNSNGTGNAVASMMLGLGTGGQITHDIGFSTASGYGALYIQDDYQVTKRLTLNAGLRWDVEVPRSERENRLDHWDPNLPSPIAGEVPASACTYCGNLMGQMIFAGQSNNPYGRHQGPIQWKDFGPRLGFAFSATDKTVLRGGFGIIFQPSALQAAGTTGAAGTDGFTSNTNFNFSFTNQETIATTFDNPAPTGFNLPQGVAGGPGTFLGTGISQTYFSSYRNPYSIEANFNIQQALPKQTVVTVGYILNAGKFLINGDPGIPFTQLPVSDLALGSQLTANVPNPFYGIITTPGAPLAAATVPYNYLLRPFPQYNSVSSFRKPGSGSHYNALTVQMNKRFSQGLSLLVSFTAGKMMDNASSPVSYLGPSSQTYANQYNPQGEFALSAQDVSRMLVSSFVYELPFGRGRQFLSNMNGFGNALVSGWQGNGIVTWDTGTPIVLGAVTNQTQLLGFAQRPTQTGNAKLSNPTHKEWFNTSVFSQPLPFTIGNAPRTLSNVRVPGTVNSDLSAFKNNYIGARERYNLQFRIEAFNALNHPLFNGPDTGVNDGTFGQINSQANSGRQVQLALKFIF